jgi:hypothetical protein
VNGKEKKDAELNYNNPANPPSGTYIIISDDPDYCNWIGAAQFATSRYCPGGYRSHLCALGGFLERVEQLQYASCRLQQSKMVFTLSI